MKPAALHARLQAVRDDHAALVRSVAIRSAFVFGYWPPLSTELLTAWSVRRPTGRGQLGSSVERGDALWGQPVG